jgi:transcriptional regulator with XRE-family HTH domain
MISNQQVGEKLRALRGDRPIASVAKDVDISVSALAMYETGQRRPRDEVKIRLAKYYHSNVGSLFYGHEVTKCEHCR